MLLVTEVWFYHSLQDDMKIHIVVMGVFTLGLLGSALAFFPAIKAGADKENWENQLEDFITLKDTELSYTRID